MAVDNLTGLSEGFKNYTALTYLNLQLYSNKIIELAPLVGILDDKPVMDSFYLYIR